MVTRVLLLEQRSHYKSESIVLFILLLSLILFSLLALLFLLHPLLFGAHSGLGHGREEDISLHSTVAWNRTKRGRGASSKAVCAQQGLSALFFFNVGNFYIFIFF